MAREVVTCICPSCHFQAACVLPTLRHLRACRSHGAFQASCAYVSQAVLFACGALRLLLLPAGTFLEKLASISCCLRPHMTLQQEHASSERARMHRCSSLVWCVQRPESVNNVAGRTSHVLRTQPQDNATHRCVAKHGCTTASSCLYSVSLQSVSLQLRVIAVACVGVLNHAQHTAYCAAAWKFICPPAVTTATAAANPLQPPGQCHCWQLPCPRVCQSWHDGAHPILTGLVSGNRGGKGNL
jgi:hypothetical protein